MNREQHTALISVRVFSVIGIDIIKKCLNEIGVRANIEDVSSIFQVEKVVHENKHIHDLRSREYFFGLCLVIKVETELVARDLLSYLQKVEKQIVDVSRNKVIYLRLLTYDDQTIMVPSLTLPHPDFHLLAEDLIPAAEIWGDYVHPVLKQTLSSLVKKLKNTDFGSFYAQGKSLL